MTYLQSNKLDKNAINETIRESCKQRFLNSLKQTQQRLCNVPYVYSPLSVLRCSYIWCCKIPVLCLMCRIDPETSSVFFENECYKKYGKTGKSFYLSQVASTVRWLSTANAEDLTSRLATCQSPTLKNETEVEPSSTISPAVSDEVRKMMNEKDHVNVSSGDINSPSQSTYNDIKLPPIPSFSEFINKKSSKDSKHSTLKRESSYGVNKKPDKRSRF